MPWCDACARFSNPNSLSEDGGCPGCGTVIAEAETDPHEGAAAGLRSIPWHFWLLLISLVIYLGWRLIEGIAYVIDKL